MSERKVVSTQVVHCHHQELEGVDAVVIVFDNGDTEVRCELQCDSCPYRRGQMS